MEQEEKPFSLKTTDKLFIERQKNVFDSLNDLPCNLQKESVQAEEYITPKTKDRRVMKQFRGKESIFKRPQEPMKKSFIRDMPDFKKNPHKWKKYSLEDVGDMTDRVNARAAYSFLNQLKSRNAEEEGSDASEEPKKKKACSGTTSISEQEDDVTPSLSPQDPIKKSYIKNVTDSKRRRRSMADLEHLENIYERLKLPNQLENTNDEEEMNVANEEPKKIVFKKTYSAATSSSEQDDVKPTFRNSKVVMPEYIVGMKMKKQKKNKIIRSDAEKQLKLDHLFEDE